MLEGSVSAGDPINPLLGLLSGGGGGGGNFVPSLFSLNPSFLNPTGGAGGNAGNVSSNYNPTLSGMGIIGGPVIATGGGGPGGNASLFGGSSGGSSKSGGGGGSASESNAFANSTSSANSDSRSNAQNLNFQMPSIPGLPAMAPMALQNLPGATGQRGAQSPIPIAPGYNALPQIPMIGGGLPNVMPQPNAAPGMQEQMQPGGGAPIQGGGYGPGADPTGRMQSGSMGSPMAMGAMPGMQMGGAPQIGPGGQISAPGWGPATASSGDYASDAGGGESSDMSGGFEPGRQRPPMDDLEPPTPGLSEDRAQAASMGPAGQSDLMGDPALANMHNEVKSQLRDLTDPAKVTADVYHKAQAINAQLERNMALAMTHGVNERDNKIQPLQAYQGRIRRAQELTRQYAAAASTPMGAMQVYNGAQILAHSLGLPGESNLANQFTSEPPPQRQSPSLQGGAQKAPGFFNRFAQGMANNFGTDDQLDRRSKARIAQAQQNALDARQQKAQQFQREKAAYENQSDTAARVFAATSRNLQQSASMLNRLDSEAARSISQIEHSWNSDRKNDIMNAHVLASTQLEALRAQVSATGIAPRQQQADAATTRARAATMAAGAQAMQAKTARDKEQSTIDKTKADTAKTKAEIAAKAHPSSKPAISDGEWKNLGLDGIPKPSTGQPFEEYRQSLLDGIQRGYYTVEDATRAGQTAKGKGWK